jgi:hypothetical protein
MDFKYQIDIVKVSKTQLVEEDTCNVPKELRREMKINRCHWKLRSDIGTSNIYSHVSIQIGDACIFLDKDQVETIVKFLEIIKY